MYKEYEVDGGWDDLFDSEESQIEKINRELFDNLLIWSTDWTIGTIFGLIEKNKIDLNPKMQRRDVWSNQKKSNLIESILLNIPIPQIILAEKKDKKGQYMVIDGKQRLLSITQFLAPISSNKLLNEEFKTVTLKKLEGYPELQNLNSNDIQNNTHLDHIIDIFENQTIRTIIIKNWSDESILFTIFNRLNTGTEPLSAQELRMTLFPGLFIEYVNGIESEPIKELLKIKSFDSRMKDVELIIRYYSFKYFINKYDGNLRTFFDLTTKSLNSAWKEKEKIIKKDFLLLENGINLAFEIFSKDSAFKKYDSKDDSYSRQFNKTSFDLLIFFLSNETLNNKLNSNTHNERVRFRQAYESLFTDEKIVRDFESHTSDLEKVKYRFLSFANLLDQTFNFNFRDEFIGWDEE